MSKFLSSASKVEKKKVRWADEPRQQASTEGILRQYVNDGMNEAAGVAQ